MDIKKYGRIKTFNFRGVPVYMGWSLYPVVILVILGMFSDVSILVGAISWWGVMVLHEFGHMWYATRQNLRVFEIQLHLFHGLCEYEKPEFPYTNYVIAWGGVIFQLFIAIPCIIILMLIGKDLPWYLLTPVFIFGPASLMIAVINLVPSEGFDGAVCWKAIPLYFKYQKPRKKKNPFKIVK